MKVILAGFSKTGTKTMAHAFEMLGYNTYDYLENMFYLHKEWVKVISEGSTAEDFRRMYEGVDAVTDMPCFFFWEQLHEAFPDAKIILTVRDEEKWYKSGLKQMNELNGDYFLWFLYLFSPTAWSLRSYRFHINKLVSDVASYPRNKRTCFGETLMRKVFREHNFYVQQKAPKDKLLVYEVAQGWGPLCEFLGVEIPDEPFPHKNKGANFSAQVQRENKLVKRLFYEAVLCSGVFVSLCAYAGYKICQHIDFGDLCEVAWENVLSVKNYLV